MKPRATRKTVLRIAAVVLCFAAAWASWKLSWSGQSPISFPLNEHRREALEKFSVKSWDAGDQTITFRWVELEQYINGTPAQRRNPNTYTAGIWAGERPRDMAMRHAGLLVLLARALEKPLGAPTGFDLRLFTTQIPESLIPTEGKADLFIMDAAAFLTASSRLPQLIPLAGAGETQSCVVFANKNTGLDHLDQLKGRSFLFSDAHSSMTILAKARLAAAGISRHSLQSCTYLNEPGVGAEEPLSSKNRLKIVAEVWSGHSDAGVLPAKNFNERRTVGLVSLVAFTNTPQVLVARQGLPADFIQALRKAVASLPNQRISGVPPQMIKSFVPITPDFFDGLRKAMKLAEEFDGGSVRAHVPPQENVTAKQ